MLKDGVHLLYLPCGGVPCISRVGGVPFVFYLFLPCVGECSVSEGCFVAVPGLCEALVSLVSSF